MPDGPDIKTVSFVSLGCPKNLVDSEKMLGLLAQDGLVPVSADTSGDVVPDADAVVVNTCGFLEASKDESLGVIKEAVKAKEAGRIQRVIVAGCLVQRHRAKMLDWEPGIDAMIGVFDRDKVVEAVRGSRPERASLEGTPNYWISANALAAASTRGMPTTGLTVNGKDGKGIGYFEDDSARLRITSRHHAYLRVSEGCNQNCAFCTIPSIRGKMRSKPLEAIVREARELLADGTFELSLIGQDTTSYGDDIGFGLDYDHAGGGGLPAMLRAVSNAVEEAGGAGWVRLMYAYPSNFSEPMIDAFAELVAHGHLLPYIDIPLQHASDAMLTAMRRHVSAQQQEDLLERLRERIPGMAIRTTLISGFPGETDEDHQAQLDMIERVGFEALGVFEYSPEPGTVAARMETECGVPAEVKQARKDEIMALQQRLAFEQAAYLAEQFDEQDADNTGLRFDVIIDERTDSAVEATSGVSQGGLLHKGRAYFQAPSIDSVTYVQANRALSPGELVRCVIVDADGYDLIARPEDELHRRVSLRVV